MSETPLFGTSSDGRQPGVSPERTRRALATLIGLACGLAIAEGVGRAAVGGGEAGPRGERAANVREIPNNVERLPRPEPARASLLLIGNSHTYALPGRVRGEPLRPDSGSTLIDELERRIAARLPRAKGAVFYRLAYPNFLPIEMLLRATQLLEAGYRPRVVVLGLTYRNVARDFSVRPEIESLVEDGRVMARLRRFMGELGGSAAHRVERALAAEETRLTGRESRALGQSDADRLDERLTRSLGSSSVLLGESAELRARVYRPVVRFFADRLRSDERRFTYAALPADFVRNLACLDVLLRLLHASGSRLVLYFAPERSDLPPLVDPQGRPEFTRRVRALAAELDGVVLDAQNVVPARYWGWDRDTPDQSHFTEPGHRLLGDFIVERAAAVWPALERSEP